MSLTNWFSCSEIRTLSGITECRLQFADIFFPFSYPKLPTSCVFPQPEWCTDYTANSSNPGYTYFCNPDNWNYLQYTWETCAETQGTQCRFEKTILDAKYSSGTYCPYGNDSKGQVEPTYIMAIFLLLWAVYAMMFFGNSRR